jgi:hypothetical protein
MSRSTGAIKHFVMAGACVAAVGCGGGSDGIPAGVDGKVLFRDSLADNSNGWIDVEQTPHRDGRWEWNEIPGDGARTAPDSFLAAKVPAAVSVGVNVEMRDGAALRGLFCREHGNDQDLQGTYELGIDGRRALIREQKRNNPPRVLAANDVVIPNGKRVNLTARCIPDGKGLALTLLVDGKQVAQARDDDPPARGDVGLFAIARPDSPGPANLTWDTFVVREGAQP